MRPLLIHLHAEGFERAHQALGLAVAARALGQPVTLVLAYGALRALAEDRLGEPTPGPDLWSARRAEQRGERSVAALEKAARAAGVRFLACDAVALTSGVDEDQLEGKAELAPLSLIAELQLEAQLLYL